MKVVVDIPNWLYDAMMGHREPVYSQSLGEAVRDGTPLPKGHGRLIDADALKNEWKNGFHKKIVDALMDDAPTIIEASKEQEDDKNI